jgi:hypothetical protein
MDASYKMKQMLLLLNDMRGHMTPVQVGKLKQFERDIDDQKRYEQRETDLYFAQDINGY